MAKYDPILFTRRSAGEFAVLDGMGGHVCLLHDKLPEEGVSMILAAPDMLKTLKHVRQHFVDEMSDIEIGGGFLPRIRMVGARAMVDYLDAAIKKAESR